MNKKYILLGILTASALAVYSINRKYSKNTTPIFGGGQPNNINQSQSSTSPKPTMGGGDSNINTEPKINTGIKPNCPSGYVLVALDPQKPNLKTCIPTPKQDTTMPIKCPFGQTNVDGKCVSKISGGGGFSDTVRDESQNAMQQDNNQDTYSVLTTDIPFGQTNFDPNFY
jgi:hypothetical protein